MKILSFLIFLAGCTTYTDGGYKKRFHQEDFKSSLAPSEVYKLLKEKTQKCYPQSNYPVYEKTVGEFNPETEAGSITYEIDNQTRGPQPLLIIDISKDFKVGTLVQLYSKGDLFHPAGVYKHQIKKWLDGKKVDCNAQGEI